MNLSIVSKISLDIMQKEQISKATSASKQCCHGGGALVTYLSLRRKEIDHLLDGAGAVHIE